MCTMEEVVPQECGIYGTPRSGVAIEIRAGLRGSLEKRVEKS